VLTCVTRERFNGHTVITTVTLSHSARLQRAARGGSREGRDVSPWQRRPLKPGAATRAERAIHRAPGLLQQIYPHNKGEQQCGEVIKASASRGSALEEQQQQEEQEEQEIQEEEKEEKHSLSLVKK